MGIADRIEPLGAATRQTAFFVVVHDVCPAYSHEIREVVAALEPLVGRTISAAVVPNWRGAGLDGETGFTEWISRQFGEILLHGCTHERETGRGIISYVTNGSDEFAGLSPDETHARLEHGQAQLTNRFGHRIAGFVPPAWQRGRIDEKMLARHGLEFLLGFLAIDIVDGRRVPVSTVAWDVGRFGRLGPAAAMVGHALGRCRRRSVRCLAAHPADVRRGYLRPIVRAVESWMRSGGKPILPRDLLCLANKDPVP